MKQITYQLRGREEYIAMLEELEKELSGQSYKDGLANLLASGFSTDEMEAMLKEMHQRLPDMKHVGISVFRLDDSFESRYLRCSFFLFERSSVRVIQKDLDRDEVDEAAEEFGKCMDDMPHLKGVALFASGITLRISRLVEMLSKGREEIPLFGSMANNAPGEDGLIPYYLIGNTISDFGVAAVLFSGEELEIQADYVFGWQPIGKKWR